MTEVGLIAIFKPLRVMYCLWICYPITVLNAQALPAQHYHEQLNSRSSSFFVEPGSKKSTWVATRKGIYFTASKDSLPEQVLSGPAEHLLVAYNNGLELIFTHRDSIHFYRQQTKADTVPEIPLSPLGRKKPPARAEWVPIASFALPRYINQESEPRTNLIRQIRFGRTQREVIVVGTIGIFYYDSFKNAHWYPSENRQFINRLDTPKPAFPWLSNLSIKTIHLVDKAHQNNSLWLGTDQGLFLWDGKDYIQKILPNDVKDITIVSLDDNYNRIWVIGLVGFSDKKLWCIDYPKKNFHHQRQVRKFEIDLDDEILKGYPIAISTSNRGPYGDLWFSCNIPARISNIATKKIASPEELASIEIVPYGPAQGFTPNNTTALSPHPNGYLWIGSNKGPFFIRPGIRMELIERQHIRCHGQANGSFSVMITDGYPPFSFILDSISVFPRSNQEDLVYFNNLSAGKYVLFATDRTAEDTLRLLVEIEEPPLITGRIKKNLRPSYPSSKNAVAEVRDLQGGQVLSSDNQVPNQTKSNYHFRWSNRTDTIRSPYNDQLGFGPFSVTIMDTMGCSRMLRDTFKSAIYNSNLPEIQGKGVLSSPTGILFVKNSTTLYTTHVIYLKDIAAYLRGNPSVRIALITYIDPLELNSKALALEQANIIKTFFLREQITPDRIDIPEAVEPPPGTDLEKASDKVIVLIQSY